MVLATADHLDSHERWMRRCIELAQQAGARGDTPVGSVVLFEGTEWGCGSELLPTGLDITGHAERLACQKALQRRLTQTGQHDLAGAILYTTAEPCFLCSYVIRHLRIDQVIYGRPTPMIGGITSAHPILTDPQLNAWRPAPTVLGDVLRRECEQLRRSS